MNTKNALAIEVMTAAAGVDQRAPLRPSVGVLAALAAVRERVAPMTEDRPLYRDIAKVAELLSTGELLRAVQAKVGILG
jgi:histidine ammonia-lyase